LIFVLISNMLTLMCSKNKKNEKNRVRKQSGKQKKDTEKLEHLLSKASPVTEKVWRGSVKYKNQLSPQILSSGHKTLDSKLHSGGWPLSITTELGLSQPGIGELRLLVPALRELQEMAYQKQIIWIAPPFLPYAPGLIKEKIDIDRLTIVQTNTIQDTLWATEQALLSKSCAAVFCWVGTSDLDTRQLRRLQLAAEKTESWHVLFRHSDYLKQSSICGLRIHLQANSYGKLDLHIIKQPNGWGGQRCTVSLHPHYENWQRLPVNLLPNNNKMRTRVLSEKIDTLSDCHTQASVTVISPLSTLQTVH